MKSNLCLFFLISFPCFSSLLFIEGESLTYRDGLLYSSSKTTLIFEDMKIVSERIKIEKEGTISLTSAYLSTENLQFFGKKIVKEKDKIFIEDGWFSTCSKEKPHYRLTSKRIVVSPIMVKASKITLKAGDFPIFYFPFYSQPLKSKDSPYSIGLGRSDSLGGFVKTRYNYNFSEKRAGFLLDYYQKKGLGLGIDIHSDNSSFLTYCNEKRHLLNGNKKSGYLSLEIERLSDGLVLYDYFKKEIKDETKSYLRLEKMGFSSLGRLVFEEKDDFSKKIYYLPKASFFTSRRQFGAFTTSLDISGENIKQDGYTQDFTINPIFLKEKRIGKVLFLSIFDIKIKNEENHSISSLSNIRLWPVKDIKLDLGYFLLYSFREKKDKIPFLLEGFFGRTRGSIEGEFKLSENKFDNIMFLLSSSKERLKADLEGGYENKNFKASLDMELKRKKDELGLFWLIRDREKDVIVPSFLFKDKDFSLKISKYYGADDYLEFFLQKILHCINVDFRVNTKKEVGLNLSLR